MKTKYTLLSLALAAGLAFTAQGAIIFSENVGAGTGTQSYAANTFENADLTFTGTGDTRVTTPSTGYTGASGDRNVFLTNNATSTFIISGIDTSGYVEGSFELTFGAHKSINASDMTELQVAFSTNGTDFTSLSFPAQPTGSSTSNWRLVTITNPELIPSSETLHLRWWNTSASPAFRIDDITFSGTPIPEPSTYAALLGLAALGFMFFRRHSKA